MEDIHEEGKDENDIDLDILPQITEHNILESSLGEHLGRCRSLTRVLDLNTIYERGDLNFSEAGDPIEHLGKANVIAAAYGRWKCM